MNETIKFYDEGPFTTLTGYYIGYWTNILEKLTTRGTSSQCGVTEH